MRFTNASASKIVKILAFNSLYEIRGGGGGGGDCCFDFQFSL